MEVSSRKGALPKLGDTPAALWAYAIFSLVPILIYAILQSSEHLAASIGAVVIAPLITLAVLWGSRIVWSLSTLSALGSLLGAPFAARPWWAVLLEVVALGCLLAPASRRFVWGGRKAPTGDHMYQSPSSIDPEDYSDNDRPSGWYVDPSIPKRMRYWSGDEKNWRGTTRTPRGIRREWSASGLRH